MFSFVFQPKVYVVRWQVLLIIAMAVPYVLTFFQSLQLSIFFIKRSPPFFLTLWVHFVEACHTIGLGLLVFRVLPSIDNVTGLFILNGVCIVPAILNVFQTHRGLNRTLKTLTMVTDVCSIFMQLSVCFVPAILSNTNTDMNGLPWILPMSLFLVSLGYWESFIEAVSSKTRFFVWFQHGIRALRKTRPKVYVTTSLLKLFVLILTAVYSLPDSIDRQTYWKIFDRVPIGFSETGTSRILGAGRFESNLDLFHATREVFIPVIVQILSSCLCYYTGRVACKVFEN